MNIRSLEVFQFSTAPNLRKRTKAQAAAVEETLTSWRTVHPAMSALDDSEKSIKVLTDWLDAEMAKGGEARPQILSRIHMRISAMRYRLELNTIFGIVGLEVPKVPSKRKAPVKKAKRGVQ